MSGGRKPRKSKSNSQIPSSQSFNVKIIPPVDPNAPMCAGCKDTCCHLEIELTSYDISRLANYGKKNPVEFASYIPAEQNNPRAFRTSEGMVKLILNKRDDGLCIFFEDHSDFHCGVNEWKPGVCLEYPFFFDGKEVKTRQDAICPKPNFERADRSKMPKEDLSDSIWETERYLEFVSDWNKRAKGTESVTDFLNFAIKEMNAESRSITSFIRHLRRKL